MKRSKEERERLIAQARLLDRNGWSAPEIGRKLGVPDVTVRHWTGEIAPQKFNYIGPVCIHTDEASTKEKEARIPLYQRLVAKKKPLSLELECAS